MRLIGHNDIGVAVRVKHDPPLVALNLGPLRYTATEAEALELADQIHDAVEKLRTRKDTPDDR